MYCIRLWHVAGRLVRPCTLSVDAIITSEAASNLIFTLFRRDVTYKRTFLQPESVLVVVTDAQLENSGRENPVAALQLSKGRQIGRAHV